MNKNNLLILVSCILLVGCSGFSPDLGVGSGKLTPCPPTPNCVNSQGVDDNHKILPFACEGTEQEAKERLLEVLKSEARAKVITANDRYVRVEFTSLLFRFVDDVEFYISKTPTGSTIIDIRSASRLGSSDLGVNRKRIERLRSKFILSWAK